MPEQQVLRLVREKTKRRQESDEESLTERWLSGAGERGEGEGKLLHASELQFRKGF